MGFAFGQGNGHGFCIILYNVIYARVYTENKLYFKIISIKIFRFLEFLFLLFIKVKLEKKLDFSLQNKK